MNALASSLAMQYVNKFTPELLFCKVPAPMASFRVPSGLSPSHPSLDSVAHHSSPDKVAQVKAEIDRLDDTFSDRMFDAEVELAKQESKDPSYLMNFCHRLLSLSVSQKASHTKCFRENE